MFLIDQVVVNNKLAEAESQPEAGCMQCLLSCS